MVQIRRCANLRSQEAPATTGEVKFFGHSRECGVLECDEDVVALRVGGGREPNEDSPPHIVIGRHRARLIKGRGLRDVPHPRHGLYVPGVLATVRLRRVDHTGGARQSEHHRTASSSGSRSFETIAQLSDGRRRRCAF